MHTSFLSAVDRPNLSSKNWVISGDFSLGFAIFFTFVLLWTLTFCQLR